MIQKSLELEVKLKIKGIIKPFISNKPILKFHNE